MRKHNPWAIAAFVALLFLMAAVSASASKKKINKNHHKPKPAAVAQAPEPQPALPDDSADEPVISLQLDDQVSDQDVQAEPESVQQPATVASALRTATQKLREIALGYLGTPYRWGGTTPAAFDCSGFTRFLYGKLGLRIPRTAREQFKAGSIVPAGQWKPGDLIFFDMMKGYVSHVGMYLGDRHFIHASNPKSGVKIDSLNRACYRKCYVGARRYET